MPWTADHCPRSMTRLPPQARAKAIEIANALLEVGNDEGKAMIRIAIARAGLWAEGRDMRPLAPATRGQP